MPETFQPTGAPDPTGETTTSQIIRMQQGQGGITIPGWVFALFGVGGPLTGIGAVFTFNYRLQLLEHQQAEMTEQLDTIDDSVKEITRVVRDTKSVVDQAHPRFPR